MARASSDLVDALHGLVAVSLQAELVRAAAAAAAPEVWGEADGKKFLISGPTPINPQLLDKAMKFLKDNGVDAPGRTSAPLNDLAALLSDIDIDEVAATRQ